jgi:hypothetical protein
MRITVYDVLSYLASGMSEAQILADFPYGRANGARRKPRAGFTLEGEARLEAKRQTP